jgi:polyferredoxin
LDKLRRRIIQIISTVLINANVKGFVEGKIYKGISKKMCVPGLNCYSCPGALGSCPIGSFQAVLGSAKYKISFYVTGILILFGTLMGRFICGWLCPFGLFQELLYKIPGSKFKLPKWFKYVKYGILLIFVILLPLLWVNELGMGNPTFCKYICPAGTLEGGVPLVFKNQSLQNSIGILFKWKMSILVITVVLSIFTFRPFCKMLCPLGAIYALFNPISFYRYKIDEDKCTNCGRCVKVCKMDEKVNKTPNSFECIRCGECKIVCPQNAIETVGKTKNIVKGKDIYEK